MPGVARERRYPERAWRQATASDIAELRAWMLARHSRRHSDELEQWVAAIAVLPPQTPPALSRRKLRWFRSVLVRYGPPGRRWEQPETSHGAYRRLVRVIRSARFRRQNAKKRRPAPSRTARSHSDGQTDSGGARSSRRTSSGSRSRERSRSRSRSSSSSNTSRSTNGHPIPGSASDVQPQPREKEPAPPHW